MPYRREQFNNGDIYHVVARGIDENLIFKDIDDYYRGIFSIYEFNNANPVEIFRRRRDIRVIKNKFKKLVGGPVSHEIPDLRDRLVNIFCFCLMPNHIHLLLQQIKNNGINHFMSKVGTGYAGYFNRKYKRKGYLFQNRFRAIPIETNEQLQIVFAYIHANPTSLMEPKWKELGVSNSGKVNGFLKSYKWSSYSDYIGIKNFPSLTNRNFIFELMNGEKGCMDFVESYISYKEKVKSFSEIHLE